MTSAKTAPGEGVERLGADRVYTPSLPFLRPRPMVARLSASVAEPSASISKSRHPVGSGIRLYCGAEPTPLHTARPLRAIYGGIALPQRKLGSLQLFAA